MNKIDTTFSLYSNLLQLFLNKLEGTYTYVYMYRESITSSLLTQSVRNIIITLPLTPIIGYPKTKVESYKI
jgi:hypothetical protein